jgi:hypothetical protein
MFIGWQEILIILILILLLLIPSMLGVLSEDRRWWFRGFAYAYKYDGLRVATRVPASSRRFAWIALGVIVVMIVVIVAA